MLRTVPEGEGSGTKKSLPGLHCSRTPSPPAPLPEGEGS
jgi:hypothetical protein